jgi:hypothetical protein
VSAVQHVHHAPPVACRDCGKDLTRRPAYRVGRRQDGTPIASVIGRPGDGKERTFCNACASVRVAALRVKLFGR